MTHAPKIRRTAGYGFSKRLRLLRSSDFDRVFARRCSASGGTLIVYGATNEIAQPRLGLVVSRRIGKAVLRNRWKRALREAFRLAQHELPPLDLVCLPKGPSPPPAAELQTLLCQLAASIAKKLAPRR